MDTGHWLNLLTGGLAIATGWMAFETRRMATASRAQIELQGQPHLAFGGFDIATARIASIAEGGTSAGVRLGLVLRNPGSVLVSYEVIGLTSTLGGVDLSSPSFHTFSGVIHPAETTLFLLPFVSASDGYFTGLADVDLEIAFWAVRKEKRVLRAKVRLEVLSLDPFNWQWVYLSGPTYS